MLVTLINRKALNSAAMLVGFAEHAIETIENAMEQVDDSNGELGGIVYRLGELHLKACALAKLDRAALAERLFRFETTLPGVARSRAGAQSAA